jgi:hypothetical protein
MGVVKTPSPVYQKQIAPTIAALLGFEFLPDQGSVKAISTLVQ